MILSCVGDREEKLTSGPDHLEEHMVHPMVRIDNNIAMVWGAYEAMRNGKPDHCGTNIFSLVNRDGRWLIASITDTAPPDAMITASVMVTPDIAETLRQIILKTKPRFGGWNALRPLPI
jgi:hypothetical protein